MNELKEIIDRELAHVQGDLAALAAIRQRALRPRRRTLLLVAGGLVPIGTAAVIAAVLLTGHHPRQSGTTRPVVGVLQQATSSGQPPSMGPASPEASPTSSAATSFGIPLTVRAVTSSVGERGGAVYLTGTVPQVGYVGGAPAGPSSAAFQNQVQQEQAAIDAVNAAISARIAAPASGAFGAGVPLVGTVSTHVLETGRHVVSVYVTTETTTSVGAHPDDEVQSLVIDLDDASIVDPTTFFRDDSAALAALSQQAESLLAEQIPAEEIVKEGLAPTAENFRYLSPTAAGLRVDFPYYKVAPRPYDAPHIVIPWSVVDPLLTRATAGLFGR